MKISNAQRVKQIQDYVCRRDRTERRSYNSTLILGLFNNGRRENQRRQDDRSTFRYLDRYEPHLLGMTALIVLCSMIDAFLTIEILNNGGRELNIFADVLISQGLTIFVISKYLITVIGMMVLIIHKHHILYFGLTVKHIIYSFVLIYSGLMVYELSIILQFTN